MKSSLVRLACCLLLGCGGAQTTTEAPHETGDAHHAHGQHAHGHHDHAAGHPGADRHHHGQGHEHGFSDVERYAAIFDADDRDEWQQPEQVIAHMGIEPGMTVVDIGAGTGYFLPHLARAVGPTGCVLALDVEPNMVEHMQARIEEAGWDNVRARVVEPGDPGLAPASVDRVLIVDTWHHIEARQDYGRRLATALGGSSPGQLHIVDFTMEAPFGPPASMRLSSEAAVGELTAASMRAEAIEETLPHQWIVVGTAAPSDAARGPSPCEGSAP